jgi:hypothetical protein
MQKLILYILFISVSYCYGQKQDRVWCFGDSSGIDFNNLSNPQAITSGIGPYSFYTYASLSDSFGNLQLYAASIHQTYYGVDVFNRVHNVMLNGDSLSGCNVCALQILPFPSDSTHYYLFSITANGTQQTLVYSIIDMTQDSGRGGVISRDNLLYGPLIVMKLVAIKHGNGRDWWLIGMDYTNNYYFKFLITASGILGPFNQSIGSASSCFSDGQIGFSADGSKMFSLGVGGCVDLFDFDRCSGMLSNFRDIGEHDWSNEEYWYFGGAFSPNGNVLYTTPWGRTKNVYQYDLSVANIQTTRTIIKSYPDTGQMLYTSFGMLQLGPDGKIYVTKGNHYGPNSNTSFTQSLDVIEYPDSLGLACNYVSNGFYLGGHFNNGGLPNMPNYNLGRDTGSTCDSLSAVHDFNIRIDGVEVFPNPSKGIFSVRLRDATDKIVLMRVDDILGVKVFETKNSLSSIDIGTKALGVYFLQIQTKKKKIFNVKLIKEK